MSSDIHTSAEAGKITVDVAYNGVTESVTISSNETVHALLERAMDLFHITNQRHIMALYRSDGTEVTPETMSLADAHISTGTLLVLRPSAVKGGAS